MTPRPWATAAALVTVALMVVAARKPQAGAAPAPPAFPADSLVVVFSGEQNGHLTPCGCSKPMVGGVPRRASFLRALRPEDALVRVENGDLTPAAGRQDELKAETLIEMLADLKYDAVNLGEKDFRLGLPFLQSLKDRFPGALVCANARGADDQALFREYVVVTRQIGGKPARVLIAGVLSEQFRDEVSASDPTIKVEAPEAALDRMKDALGKADTAVLLFHGPADQAADLAERFPGFRVVIAAHQGDGPADTKRAADAAVVSAGQDGKYVGTAVVTRGATWKVGEVRHTTLGPDHADDRKMLEIKQGYLERVTAEELLEKVPKSPTSNGDRFAGTAACAACHAKASATWKASGHGHALKTLVTEKHDRDPECVTCHVVGLDRESGFLTFAKTPGLANVGCESCHGPAARHVADPKVKLGKAGSESCGACHVPEHSPKFEFEGHWQKIKHR